MKFLYIYLILFSFISCTDNYPSTQCRYLYNNETTQDVDIVIYSYKGNDTISIDNGVTYSMERIVYAEDPLNPFKCDSLALIFNSAKKVIYKWTDVSLRNPLLLESYEKTKIDDYHYEFRYTITEQDYIDAGN